jgi:hypothetical protein
MPAYPFVFGMMPFKPLVISSIVSPPLLFTISLFLPNYLKLHLITLFSKFLAVRVGLIFVPITPINFNLVLFNMFFLVTIFAIEVTNTFMCLLITFIYPVMLFFKKTVSHFFFQHLPHLTDPLLPFLGHILAYCSPCMLKPVSTAALLQPGLPQQAQRFLQ